MRFGVLLGVFFGVLLEVLCDFFGGVSCVSSHVSYSQSASTLRSRYLGGILDRRGVFLGVVIGVLLGVCFDVLLGVLLGCFSGVSTVFDESSKVMKLESRGDSARLI